MRLQPRRPPHGVHEAVRRADRPRHRPARPVRRVRRPLLRRTPDDLRPQRRLSLRAPAPVVAPAGTLLLDPLQPLVRIAPPPAAHFVRVRPELPGDRRVRHPPGRHQHDPRPLPQPHRRAPRPRPTLQNLPVPVRKLDPDRLPHGSSLSTPLDPARRETITLTTIVTRLYCGHYTRMWSPCQAAGTGPLFSAGATRPPDVPRQATHASAMLGQRTMTIVHRGGAAPPPSLPCSAFSGWIQGFEAKKGERRLHGICPWRGLPPVEPSREMNCRGGPGHHRPGGPGGGGGAPSTKSLR